MSKPESKIDAGLARRTQDFIRRSGCARHDLGRAINRVLGLHPASRGGEQHLVKLGEGVVKPRGKLRLVLSAIVEPGDLDAVTDWLLDGGELPAFAFQSAAPVHASESLEIPNKGELIQIGRAVADLQNPVARGLGRELLRLLEPSTSSANAVERRSPKRFEEISTLEVYPVAA